jgi:DNA-binding SARP family transcriptional activator
MDFAVLGPVAVKRDGGPVPLGPAQRRTVLAVLLGQPNRRVSAGHLVDAVWGDVPPPTAAKNLQVHVYHLRRLLGDPDRIRHCFAGYLLRAEPDEIDAGRFERLLATGQNALGRGDLQRAEAALTTALDQWQGPAFAELAGCGPLVGEALRLGELRLVAREALNETRLLAGRYAGLIAELLGLLTEHPFRERLAGQLMIALYRDARRHEALDVFHRLRRALAEDLGLDPGPRLVEVYRSILRSEEHLTSWVTRT